MTYRSNKRSFSNNKRRFAVLALLFALTLVSSSYFNAGASAGLSGVTAIPTATLHSPALKSREQVRTAGDLNIERRGHTATTLADGRLLIIGGENQNGQVSDAEIFNSRSRTSALAAKSLVARTDHTATRLADGRVLVIGGRGLEGPLNSTEIYDPETGSFSYGPALNQARAGHSATMLADGRILIAGGNAEANAEIFDPAAQTFTPVEAHLSAPRAAHAATLLRNGKVLIAGGLDTEGNAAQSAELFDPATMSFSATRNPMHIARMHPTLRVLADGKVQVIGGDKEGTMEMFNAEGEYFIAYAHLLDGPVSSSEILSAQTRDALLSRTNAREKISPLKLSGAQGGLFDRGDYSLSEIRQARQIVLAGGVNGAGAALKSVVTMTATTATVTTDKTDYVAGETVIITGTGWQPGGTVTLLLHDSDGDPDRTYTAVADSGGSFTNTEFSVDAGDFESTFTLTATGLDSNDQAASVQTTFTDPAGLAISGKDNNQHTSAPTEEDLGSFSSGSPVSLTCPRGTGLTVSASASGTTVWGLAYAIGYGNDSTLSPLTTLTPNSGTFASGGSSACVAMTITTGSLSSGTYHGQLAMTAFPFPAALYFFKFTVTSSSTPPTITCPGDITVNADTGSCSKAVTFAVTTTGTPAPSVVCTHASGSTFSVGATTVNCTATNSAGSASCSFNVRVKDTQPPTLTLPSNINVVDNAPGACGAVVSYTATATDNCSGASVVCTPASGSTFPVGTTTVNCTASDASPDSPNTSGSFMVTVTNPAPVVTITGPASGSLYVVGSTVNFTGTFTDNAGDNHTGNWTFDAINQAATITESSGSGSANTSHLFDTAGVYSVTLTVTDDCGQATTATTVDGLTLLIVVYDPNGGFVTGGGWINSPAGAYVADPSLTGKANFGFVSKYHNGASVPTGNTEFQFKAGNLNFSSTSYDWLVISGGKKAQYKGLGTINGSGSYRFMLTAIDGDQPGGGGQDKFRIRIWSDGGGLVYDNQLNAPDSDDPTTVLGGGSIVIHH